MFVRSAGVSRVSRLYFSGALQFVCACTFFDIVQFSFFCVASCISSAESVHLFYKRGIVVFNFFILGFHRVRSDCFILRLLAVIINYASVACAYHLFSMSCVCSCCVHNVRKLRVGIKFLVSLHTIHWSCDDDLCASCAPHSYIFCLIPLGSQVGGEYVFEYEGIYNIVSTASSFFFFR